MGKTTKGQVRSKARGMAKPTPVSPPKDLGKGIYVTRQGDEQVQAFEGNFECQLTPDGSIAIVEMVADVGNKNKGVPTPQIRQFINKAVWAEVIIK